MSVSFDLDLLNRFGNDDVECKETVKEVLQLSMKFLALVDRKSIEKAGSLEIHRQELIAELEAAERYGRSLAGEQASYYVENAGVDNAVKKANHELHVYRRDFRPNPIFALKHDLEQFDQTVEKLEAALKDAIQVQSDYNSRVQGWRSREYENSQKVQQLTDQIKQTWRVIQRLEGKLVGPSWSRENGLPIPADEGQMKVTGVGDIPFKV